MYIKEGVLLLALIAGCVAYPASQLDADLEQDMSLFFDHVDPNSRIVGGTQAANGAHPHMAAITNGVISRSLVCGGSIITQRTICTAAHCIRPILSGGSLSSSARVTVGTNRWNSGGETYTLQTHRIHPSYSANTIKNDIGLLITSSNIVMNNRVRPIPVSYDWVGQGVRTVAAGWGRVRANGPISANLLELTKSVVDGAHCAREVPRVAALNNVRNVPAIDPAVEICTFHSINHGMCNGDSGSALVRTDRGQQIGLVSWGLPCAIGAPDMFVRISAFRSWVESNTTW